MNNLLVGGGLALGLGLAAASGAAADELAPAKGSKVTLTGCVAGSDSDSFVLTHVQKLSPDGVAIANAPVFGPNGMENGPGDVIYWLSHDSVKKMRGHVGHRVEVMGTITDLTMGTVEVTQEPGKPGRDNKVEVEARGKEASARTDRPVEPGPLHAPGTKTEEKKTLPTYRVEVDTVKMVAPTCP